MRKSLAASSAEETEQIGAWLAAARPAGNALMVVYLTGDLGAGKTTLAQGFLRAAGVTGAVKSPTYTLVETYRPSPRPEALADPPCRSVPADLPTYVHLDLYRLLDPSELENLGLRDWAVPAHVWLVEWPERGAGHLPPADLVVRLTGGGPALALGGGPPPQTGAGSALPAGGAGGGPAHVIEIEAASALGEAWLGKAWLAKR